MRVSEIIKYAIAFAVLLGIFFGGTYLLKGFLGTDYPMMVVVSQSMVPTLGVGDYIFVQHISGEDINAEPAPNGDIIVFLSPGSTDEYIVHRAINRYISDGSISFQTKGDNNQAPDSFRVPTNNIIGKVIGRVPIIGYFSLFIKTARGFGLIIGMMALTFVIDYILPPNRKNSGRFPILSIIPLLVAPIVIGSLWYNHTNILAIEYAAIALWYLGCFITPLAFHDDDSGVMLWLYHVVLLMLPIACDIVWWTKRIAPASWWLTQGSTLPINWFLMNETQAFGIAFNSVIGSLGPGIIIFFSTLYAKRKGWEPFYAIHMKMRGIPNLDPTIVEQEPTQPSNS